mmetsp:Transcript_115693/g.327163  ORF Transcript_115693/g.327163 Transcript_115693/m.327163 type:complete len:253 (-) Transcript_115693:26-784(-)
MVQSLPCPLDSDCLVGIDPEQPAKGTASVEAAGARGLPSCPADPQRDYKLYLSTPDKQSKADAAKALGFPEGWLASVFKYPPHVKGGKRHSLRLRSPDGRTFFSINKAKQYFGGEDPLAERGGGAEGKADADAHGPGAAEAEKRGRKRVRRASPVMKPEKAADAPSHSASTVGKPDEAITAPRHEEAAKAHYRACMSGIIAAGTEDEAWVMAHPLFTKLMRGYPLPISEQEILALRAYTPREYGGDADVRYF